MNSQSVVAAGWELTINVFPPGQILKRILPSRSNECLRTWGIKLYSNWEETVEFIVLTH